MTGAALPRAASGEGKVMKEGAGRTGATAQVRKKVPSMKRNKPKGNEQIGSCLYEKSNKKDHMERVDAISI
ncbi:hypothetical protein GmRootV118_07530 [Variovorax sp. V118]